jgi:hypothetical protein
VHVSSCLYHVDVRNARNIYKLFVNTGWEPFKDYVSMYQHLCWSWCKQCENCTSRCVVQTLDQT